MDDTGRPFEDEAQALGAMENWLRDARPAAPPDLAAGVMQAIAREDAARGAFHPRASLRRWMRPRAAWIWAPVAAAAGIVLLHSLRGAIPDRPADGRSAKGAAVETAYTRAPLAAGATSADSVRCVFQLAAENAHEVCLVGSFNLWRVCETPLRRVADGTWQVTMDLPRGRHEYMLVVDGQWLTDPAARLKVDDGFGHQNAVLVL